METPMAWTELTRRQHDRKGDNYASDMTGAEWALIAPLMPPPKTIGRPRTTRLRAVFEAILCIATTGCQSLPQAGEVDHRSFGPVPRTGVPGGSVARLGIGQGCG